MGKFSYYLIRVGTIGGAVPRPDLAGSIQRLGTGEDLEFADARELIDIVTRWAGRPSKMRFPAVSGNDPE